MNTPSSTAPRDPGDGGPSFGRLVGVDILRGYAILGVVLFHLWDDIRNLDRPASWFYMRLGERIHDGAWSRVPTSLLDAFLAAEYRVPMFMMLSGVSLYMAAARKSGPLNRLSFYHRRLRQLLIPYWFAVALAFVVVCVIAVLQYAMHGQSLLYQYHHVTEARVYDVAPGTWSFIISLTLVPRLFSTGWGDAPPAVMWFVVLHVQYYLLFPFLYVLLNRHKPVPFLLAAFVVTVAAKTALIAGAGGIDRGLAAHLNQTVSIFRVFEFALGMSLGYVLVHHRDRLREAVSAPRTIVAVVAAGLLCVIGGNLIDDGSRYYGAVAAPIVIFGILMMVVPLIVKRPGRIEATAPLRGLAWVGPLSYAVLIANEPLRLIASFLRVEEIPTGLWWLYLVTYVPLTLILARPLASFLGIGRRTPTAQRMPRVAPELATEPA
jgi:peptidoglycan/LPS O-acetylase OafA/YrhL